MIWLLTLTCATAMVFPSCVRLCEGTIQRLLRECRCSGIVLKCGAPHSGPAGAVRYFRRLRSGDMEGFYSGYEDDVLGGWPRRSENPPQLPSFLQPHGP